MNDVNFYLDAAEKKMSEAVAYLDDSLAHIRAGKANVKILDSIRVEYYGSKVPRTFFTIRTTSTSPHAPNLTQLARHWQSCKPKSLLNDHAEELGLYKKMKNNKTSHYLFWEKNQCGDNIPRQSPTARNLTNLTKSIKIFV